MLALLGAGGLAILYRFAPHRSSADCRRISPGAILAAVLWPELDWILERRGRGQVRAR